jgi:Tfp pilus assembly protein PilF
MSTATKPSHFWSKLRWWWKSRKWATAPRWAPAVVAALSLVVVAALSLNSSSQEIQARYLNEAKNAYHAKNYARAQTCYERIAPVAADRPEIVYRLALTTEAAGDLGRAATLMRELAPEGSPGYAPAHFWLARQYLNASPQTPRSLASAEAHLGHALDGDLDDRDAAHGLLGTLQLNAGRLEEAQFHLAKAAATNKAFRLALAWVYEKRGERRLARQEAEVYVKFYRDRAHADPTNLSARLAWADGLTFLEEFSEAIETLKEGLSSANPAVFNACIARIHLAWYEVEKKKSPQGQEGKLIALLDSGLTHDPANRDLLNRLIEQLRLGGAGAEPSRRLLQQLLAKGGTALAPIHFALAIDARVRGDIAAEKVHFEEAYKLDPKTGIIANNLAWVLSQQSNPDLPRALLLINGALEREPNNLTYRDTRGRIHLAMQRWQDALTDFEVVLAKSPDATGLHAALAEVYGKLGLAELAAQHQSLADEQAKTKSKN